MDAFIYQAELLCSDCGEKQREHLDKAFAANGAEPVDVDDESSYDSDRYPKGPYSDGGGEADSPQHCGQCGTFLDNPLTGDGETYVRQLWREHLDNGRGSLETLAEWKEGYPWLWDLFQTEQERQIARFERLRDA